jgi:hypothetical protein
MSSRLPAPTPEPEIPEDEDEMDMDEDEEIDLDDGGVDLLEALGSMLTTEEGDTLATAMVSLKDATERIATSLEMQNKILVKILSAMKPAAVPTDST